MSRTVLLAFCVSGLMLMGFLTVRWELVFLAVPMLVLIAIGVWQSAENPTLTVERAISRPTIRADETVNVTLTVTNDGATVHELHLAEALHRRLKLVDGRDNHIGRLRSGESIELTYTVSGMRGIYRMPTIATTAYDFFGLMRRVSKTDVTGDTMFQITPRYETIPELPIRPKNTRSFAGYIPARRSGSGIDFFGVRDYRPGDSLRHINWRAVSRKPDKIFTNEFEQERVADVGLILDAREKAVTFANDNAIIEHKIAAATAVSETLLGLGNRVSLLVYGSYLNWTLPGYGKRQHQQIVHTLTKTASWQSEVFQSLNYLPTSLFPIKSQVILFSTLLDGDLEMLIRMRARGYSVLVISPNPVSFEASLLSGSSAVQFATRIARIERTLMLRQIRAAGVQVIDWHVENSLQETIGSQLATLRFQAAGVM